MSDTITAAAMPLRQAEKYIEQNDDVSAVLVYPGTVGEDTPLGPALKGDADKLEELGLSFTAYDADRIETDLTVAEIRETDTIAKKLGISPEA